MAMEKAIVPLRRASTAARDPGAILAVHELERRPADDLVDREAESLARKLSAQRRKRRGDPSAALGDSSAMGTIRGTLGFVPSIAVGLSARTAAPAPPYLDRESAPGDVEARWLTPR